MRAEDDSGAQPDLIGGPRQKDPAGAGIALKRRYGDVALGADDGLGQVVDGIDIAPRLVGRAVRRLDQIEMDAVRPVFIAAGQHDDLGVAFARLVIGGQQPFALRRAHGAVIEVETEIADAVLLFVGDLVVAALAVHRDVQHAVQVVRQQIRGRQLERVGMLFVAQIADPHRPIGGGATDRGPAPGDDRSRLAGQPRRRARVVQEDRAVAQYVLDARGAVRAQHLAQDRFAIVLTPIDLAVDLLAGRALGATGLGPYLLRRRRTFALFDPLQGLKHRLDGRIGHLVAIKAGFARLAHRKSGRRPDRAGIHLGLGLQHGDAPTRLLVQDRPVKRRRTAIPGNAGMHDKAKMLAEDALRDRALQERRQDQVGSKQVDGFLGRRVIDVQLDADLVAELGELDEQALAQAVEAAGDKENAHGVGSFPLTGRQRAPEGLRS